MFFDIVHPEMVTLGIGVRNVSVANLLHLVQQSTICQNGLAQVCPILPLTARDHIVNGREGEALMVEMAMKHGG